MRRRAPQASLSNILSRWEVYMYLPYGLGDSLSIVPGVPRVRRHIMGTAEERDRVGKKDGLRLWALNYPSQLSFLRAPEYEKY